MKFPGVVAVHCVVPSGLELHIGITSCTFPPWTEISKKNGYVCILWYWFFDGLETAQTLAATKFSVNQKWKRQQATPASKSGVSLLDISDYRSNFPLLLTSPLMVPEPMRSPGRTLHPVTV